MKTKTIISWTLLIIGGILIYLSQSVAGCTGWSIINPLCWFGYIIQAGALLFIGIALIIAGIIRLVREK